MGPTLSRKLALPTYDTKVNSIIISFSEIINISICNNGCTARQSLHERLYVQSRTTSQYRLAVRPRMTSQYSKTVAEIREQAVYFTTVKRVIFGLDTVKEGINSNRRKHCLW